MKKEDAFCRPEGIVSPSFVDIRSGRRIPFRPRHNLLSYMSAESMAAAFGGDPSYIPAAIGFIYVVGNVLPSESVITRSQNWDSLVEELSYGNTETGADVQVVGFSYSPSLGGEKRDGSSSDSSSTIDDYCNILPTGSNAITFHAVSNSSDSGKAFDKPPFSHGDTIYQAVLLGVHLDRYHILSRVSLKDGDRYLTKPEGFEVALDWTIVFH